MLRIIDNYNNDFGILPRNSLFIIKRLIDFTPPRPLSYGEGVEQLYRLHSNSNTVYVLLNLKNNVI